MFHSEIASFAGFHHLYSTTNNECWVCERLHCKNAKVVLTQFGYITFLLIVCIIKHSEVPLPALDSKQIKNLFWVSRSLVNVNGRREIVK